MNPLDHDAVFTVGVHLLRLIGIIFCNGGKHFFIGHHLRMVFLIKLLHPIGDLTFLERAVSDRCQHAVPVHKAVFLHDSCLIFRLHNFAQVDRTCLTVGVELILALSDIFFLDFVFEPLVDLVFRLRTLDDQQPVTARSLTVLGGDDINQWFRTEFKEENIVRGKELLAQYAKTKSIDLYKYVKPEYTEACKRKYGFKDWDSVCAAIGHGGLKEGQVINKLIYEYEKKNKRVVSDEQVKEAIENAKEAKGIKEGSESSSTKSGGKKSGIVVMGLDDLAVRFSRCCNPVPGDEIVGFVTRGRGISIHRTDCVNMIHLPVEERNRLIEAEWSAQAKKNEDYYPVEIVIYSYNRSGVLFDVSKIFTENEIDVKSMNVRTSKQDKATIVVGFETRGVEQLNKLVKKLRNVESVIDIERRSNG